MSTLNTGITSDGSGRLARLEQRAAQAAAIRAHQTHPDVIALAVEKVRTQVDVLLWVAIVAGLGFTMVNVQAFAAHDSISAAAWWTAWLLDPMVSLALLAVLRAEQVTARYQVSLNRWAHITKWLTFAATYTMNTWQSWAHGAPDGVVLHSVPPLVVFAAAEAGPGLRDRLTEAVRAALTEAHGAGHVEPTRVNQASSAVVASEDAYLSGLAHAAEAEITAVASTRPLPDVAADLALDTDATDATSEIGEAGGLASGPASRPARTGARRGKRKNRAPARRRLKAEYLAEARARLTPEVAPTPKWVREVTGCGNTVSSELAAILRAEHTSTATQTTSIRHAEAA